MSDLGDSMLMIVTDRISAFDIVFDECIPDKGKVLNSISHSGLNSRRASLNHVISTNPRRIRWSRPTCRQKLVADLWG